MRSRDRFAELLYGPLRRGMRCDIDMKDQRGYDVPVATQTRLSFDVILPLWGRRGHR
jgi:hypothetical protein